MARWKLTTSERFWAKVNKNGPIPPHRPELGPCHIWTAARFPYEYGAFWDGEKLVRAHRFAWEQKHGKIPYPLQALHHCDNPPCVNDAHLFIGTRKDNMMDMSRKGRQIFQRSPERCARGDRNGARLYPERIFRGESVGTSKLTADDVRQIRALRGLRQRDIGKLFGVSQAQIQKILTGQSWKHI